MVAFSFSALRKYMLDKGYVQETLAQAVGMTQATLSGRMNRKHPFTAWEMKRISQVLDIPPEQFAAVFCEMEQECETKPKGKAVRLA